MCNISGMIDFSVIVPCWRGAVKYLPTLFDSIPQKDGIEIIVVDNSENELKRDEIASERVITLLHSDPTRHAGGSRNDGMNLAKGKWLIFADADDYFTPNAFEVFYSHLNSDAEIVYTKPEGRYEDTGEISERGDYYANLVHGYCVGKISEEEIRLGFGPPWCKMIRRDLVIREGLKFDEIKACNDLFFSITSGYYAKSIEADDRITYIVTVNHGSLTQRRDYDVIKARLIGKIHCNQFLKSHGLKNRQRSIMSYIAESRHFGIKSFIFMVGILLRERQNPFIGWQRWKNTAADKRIKEKKDERFLVR